MLEPRTGDDAAQLDVCRELEGLVAWGDSAHGLGEASASLGVWASSEDELASKDARREALAKRLMEEQKQAYLREHVGVEEWQEAASVKRRRRTTPRAFRGADAAADLEELCQLLSSAMLQSPLPELRRQAHGAVLGILQRCSTRSRWLLLRALCVRCPYDAVRGLYLDVMRQNVVAQWDLPAEQHSSPCPFLSPHVAHLVRARLRLAGTREQDDGLDATAACLSLLRILLLRDGKHEEARTGIWTPGSVSELRASLRAILAAEDVRRASLDEIESNQRAALIQHPATLALGIINRCWEPEEQQRQQDGVWIKEAP
uniref:Uncharacterized protein n=1 Tax=Phaeomonas parva TaxID=124430 RepID=A0A7S1U9K5_9STRA|mmetsp:Transcript_37982/g.119181  ORF Transcript_37982/g.119181 Transcript_37982/m.119181 type:complete len:316 (+) Transcript_37982:443-1390(+)